MLWCKSTFTARYGNDACKIFPTQQQLFEFIDGVRNNESEDGVAETWLPFGIEFPSEEEMARELPLRALREAAVEKGAHGRHVPLFRRRPTPSCCAGDVPSHSNEQKEAVVDDYAVLYGTMPLSSQTRMFLAATIEAVARVVRDIEPLQLHLYEIIREGSHCHMYLDVERERDYSLWRPVVEIADDGISDGEADHEDCSVTYECRSREEYTTALTRARWRPLRCCTWDCKLRADNSATTTVLLEELHAFLRRMYPALMGSPSDECETVTGSTISTDTTGAATTTASSLERTLGPKVDVMVMRSVTQKKPLERVCANEKFSQHYVVYFDDHWFSSNADVGRLVRQFVDYLYERVMVTPHVHNALFYHDTPRNFPVLPAGEGSSPNLPFLPLRCIIDTAVYSRNRMLRCLGSCKLHKSSILVVERCPTALRRVDDPVALFFASLVSLQVGHRSLISVPAAAARGDTVEGMVTPHRDLHDLKASKKKGGGMTPRLLLEAEAERYRALAEHVEREWSSVAGVACSVDTIRLCGGRYVLLLLGGSRFCGNVGRQHRSNRVYISVDMQERVWVQKCFDPDCVTYRSTPREVPIALLHDAHNWARETRASALASHRSLRTPFRPLEKKRQ